MALVFLTMTVLSASAEVDGSASNTELWAGEIVLSGARRVPVLGEMTYTSRARTLATVVRTDKGLDFSIRHCSLDFPKSPGVKLVMEKESARAIPPSHYFLLQESGNWSVEPSVTAWDATDLDADGAPGITMIVDSVLCGGRLMLANKATTTARNVTVTDGGYRAEYSVLTEQTVLKTKGLCLSLFSKSMTDTMTGSTQYARVPDGTKCDAVDWSAIYANETSQPVKEEPQVESAPQ
jgi:hypothetical protein